MKTLKSLFDDFNLTQIKKNLARVTNKCKSTIDLISTNIDRSIIKNSGVLDYIISDHLPVYINIKRTKCRREHVRSTIRSYRYYYSMTTIGGSFGHRQKA